MSVGSTWIVDPGVMTSVMISWCHNVNIWKTKQDIGLISIEDVQEIVYAESNCHVTDDVTRPYNVMVMTMARVVLGEGGSVVE